MKIRHHVIAMGFLLGLLNSSTTTYAATDSINNALNTPLFLINQPVTKTTFSASLLIINSHAATFSKSNKQITLTLENVEPYVVKFTVGPNRKTSLITTDDWLKHWKRNKHMDYNPSNAALAGVSVSGKQNQPNYLLVLTNPKYDAIHATLTFKVKLTDGSVLPQNIMTLTSVSLVVDDGLQVARNTIKRKFLGKSVLASSKRVKASHVPAVF